MSIILSAGIFIAGLALIIKSSDIFIDAASWMSDVTGFSKAVIGATIVSFATTSPEYFVSLIAVIKGHNDLSIGNAVGSINANLGIAFAALAIFTPGVIKERLFGVKGLLMIMAAVILLLFCLNGTVSVFEGIVLLLLFLLSVFLNIRYSQNSEGIERKQTNKMEIAINTAKFTGGAAGIIFGSNLIVDNGIVIASFLGVSEAVIGLTFIAIGTSLPEIITSITAIIKKQRALSIGNIVGANIIDTTLIFSTGAFISGGQLTVPQSAAGIDLSFTIFLMVLAVLPVMIGKKIYRLQGVLLAGFYIAYLLYRSFF